MPPQRKQQEVERAQKWLKMVKKWDKYSRSDRVRSRKSGAETK